MHKNVFILPVSFTGSYTGDEPKVPRQNNLILQENVSGVDKIVNFKDFFKNLNQIQGLFKIIQTMICLGPNFLFLLTTN